MSEDLRDRALTQDIQDVLAEHPVLKWLPLTVEVRGFIAHVRGRAGTVDERRLVGKVVRRVRGVYAVWDLIEVPGQRPDRVLDIGCGHAKQLAASVGLDRHGFPPVDVIADLDCRFPFGDEVFDQVFAVHVLEHIRDVERLMNEIHRVLRPRGVLHVIVPRWDHVNAVADPTHLRLFHVQTFKHFCTDKPRAERFRPLLVAAGADVVVADLEPVKSGEPPPTALELAHYFD
jgi:SAM-dependent methyltransferase